MALVIAGVDEAGRGPLAGPVVAAAVILNPDSPISGINDSKQLTGKRRDELYGEIARRALAWCVAEASVEEIDSINILQATLLAMARAIEGLGVAPGEVWVDGNRTPRCTHPVRAIVQGDATVPAIGAASILAKVHRDRLMTELDSRYPGYGFAQHKGYPCQSHLAALQELGVSPVHRRTFRPVRELL